MRAELERTRPPGGIEIRLVTGDSGGWSSLGGTPLVAEVARARRLVADSGVVVVVGPAGSREALLVAPVFRDAGIMQLVPTGTSRRLHELRDWTLMLAPDDSVQGEFIGQFADSALKARRVAVFYVPDEYGIGLAAGTATALVARGATILLRTPIQISLDCRTAANEATYEGLVAQLAHRGTPDAVVIAARQLETACLARALRRRWPRVPVLAGDGTLPSPEFFAVARGGAEGAHIVAFWHPARAGEEAAEFVARFDEAMARPVRHADAVYYDAVMTAAAAIRDEGRSRGDVRRYLLAIGNGRPPLTGLTGPLAFTRGFRRPLIMTRVQGTTVVPLGMGP